MMHATMTASVAPPSPRLELSLRNLLLLAAPALAIVLRWVYGWSTGAVMLAIAPILVFSFALTPMLRWRARQFERELLRRYIEALTRSGSNAKKLQVELALKIAIPFICLLITLFGAPLAISTP